MHGPWWSCEKETGDALALACPPPFRRHADCPAPVHSFSVHLWHHNGLAPSPLKGMQPLLMLFSRLPALSTTLPLDTAPNHTACPRVCRPRPAAACVALESEAAACADDFGRLPAPPTYLCPARPTPPDCRRRAAASAVANGRYAAAGGQNPPRPPTAATRACSPHEQHPVHVKPRCPLLL